MVNSRRNASHVNRGDNPVSWRMGKLGARHYEYYVYYNPQVPGEHYFWSENVELSCGTCRIFQIYATLFSFGNRVTMDVGYGSKQKRLRFLSSNHTLWILKPNVSGKANIGDMSPSFPGLKTSDALADVRWETGNPCWNEACGHRWIPTEAIFSSGPAYY